MKTLILALLVLQIHAANAAQKINVIDPELSKSIVNALSTQVTPKSVGRAGGATEVYQIGRGLTCTAQVALGSRMKKTITAASCGISLDSWANLGQGSFSGKIFGSSKDQNFTAELYTILDRASRISGLVNAVDQTGVRVLSIQSVRNSLQCSIPTDARMKAYIQPSCQITNR